MSFLDLFGYQISNKGLAGDVNSALDFIKSGDSGHYMACVNPHSLTVAAKDNVFQQALKRADILIPDGTGIVIAAKILGLPCTEKVAGTDFFLGLSREANKRGGIRYFLAIEVCGTYSPPFKTEFSQEDNSAMISVINNARPDVLWIGMTAPKQEKWIYENRSKLQVPFIAAIGAVFDFYAGTKNRSSEFWIRIGLEWLPRFLKEPKRLWERNLKSTPIFLWWVMKEKIKLMIRQ
jgi:N-acetylglucosaminyldiphosphoundecaprenol N-acetyl-beta-D-mannosaminyltransferase